MFEIVRRPRAIKDIIHAAYYLAAESDFDTADRFLKATESAFTRLQQSPEIGVKRELLSKRFASFRMWPLPDFPKFLIFYLIHHSAIEIVRVLHGAQDVLSLLGKEK